MKYLLLWLILNLMVMTMAYALNNQKLILDKKEDGLVSLFLLLINLPWLLFSWSVFALQMLISKESRVDKIIGSSIFIASRPSTNFDYSSYDIVVDLTSEFLKNRTKGVEYISYSNLDGMPLSKSYENVAIFQNKKVLVHCANGHGRSALFVAGLLVDLELVENFEEGLALIKKSRPLAVPNAGQF
ncbi:MAG: dual specificity protein phosphatase family protein [Sulfurovaceae bacterium]|nr:dual specificity protein phosphatase family protein [Sulfurovaceae bacterium]